MSIIFQKLELHAKAIKDTLEKRLHKANENHPFPWANDVYVDCNVRRAHLDVVDVRDTKKLYMMHLCIFPKVYDSAPIFGFDIIAGPNKVTGAFLDFSPSGDIDHPMCKWFKEEVSKSTWSKQRKLPEWAETIFSPSIVAASNINSEFELNEILSLSLRALNYYLDNLYKFQSKEAYELKIQKYDFTSNQNNYCINQKKNPHTPKVMESLGFDKETVRLFIDTCLFPEITK